MPQPDIPSWPDRVFFEPLPEIWFDPDEPDVPAGFIFAGRRWEITDWLDVDEAGRWTVQAIMWLSTFSTVIFLRPGISCWLGYSHVKPPRIL